ncbi:unnamed protein product [Aureobasidium mustum]|uniref:Uncharacterized protein n=1 Tax=Aureobasidium mustum TaxID=2773714 RepID=A0A9N8JZU6_9PEZI|nr:unnamed protein product [Aureobasidium mustum]
MRGPPPQSDHWSHPNESVYKTPKRFNEWRQPQHPQLHNDARSTDYNHFSPSAQHAASGVPMFGDHWPLHDLAFGGMAVPADSMPTSAAPPTHFQYVEYDHTLHPPDRLHIHYSVAPPPIYEPASAAAYSSQPIPPKPTSEPEQTTQGVLDNEANLEKMRQERELVFGKAATELDRVKCDTGSSVSSNKAWEDAWETLREQMTKM